MNLAAPTQQQRQQQDAALAFVEGKGSVAFTDVPDDRIYCTLLSDKVETRFEAESIKKLCGSSGSEIPRSDNLLHQALKGSEGAHKVPLVPKEHAFELTLTLKFSELFAPTYTFARKPMTVQTEDILRGFIHDLQEELAEMKETMVNLQDTVATQAKDAADEQQRMQKVIDSLCDELAKKKTPPPSSPWGQTAFGQKHRRRLPVEESDL
ncbi:TPA: hypothetical protein N0F65_003350 [Lagenidium giganteum]|uniref:Uncharacterized protein n=1 Tax=Lagenidium giganteum TaxID=4803 RepID=A0AAV2Z6T9_9STRA|nr:TPA: hypothetical protein N0F65_003350 [Lagenidium giganteum]